MWEVVYPRSRAVELGEEDEEEEGHVFGGGGVISYAPVVRLSRFLRNEDESAVACELLVFAFGHITTAFIEAHFLASDTEIVGLVAGGKKENDLNSLMQTAPSDKTCFIHSSVSRQECKGANVLFCQSKVDYPAEYCHDWAKEIFSSIKPNKVLVLCTIPASLCSVDEEETDSVFALKTNRWKSSVRFPFLRPPNIVSDLSAAVFTHCEVFRIPAIMYVGVTGSDAVDTRAVEMFHPLLNDDPLKNVSKRPKAETLEFMKTVKITKPFPDSNMYI